MKQAVNNKQYPKFGNSKITDSGLLATKQFFDSVKKHWPAKPPKNILGFIIMTSKESPGMMFDLKMTRFPLSYNPNVIFDASP